MALDSLLRELGEEAMADVSRLHDEARLRYRLDKNRVVDDAEFSSEITRYTMYHCRYTGMSEGGSSVAAAGLAKEVLQEVLRHRGGTVVTAFRNSVDGIDGGLRQVLDSLAEGLKGKAIEYHIRDAFDRYFRISSWPNKVAIMREFISRFGGYLPASIRNGDPAQFAAGSEQIIREFSDAMRRTSTALRRL